MKNSTKKDASFSHREIQGMFDGPVLKPLVKLALPIFAGMVFQLLYNIVDTIWISRIDLNDPSYVGGTGIIFPLFFLAIAIGSGILIGTSSLVARAIGEKSLGVLNRTAESGLVMAGSVALVFVVFGYIYDEQLIRLLGARGDYYTHALEYYHFILPAAAMMFMGNVFNGILQGEGLMDKVMKSMIIATVMNIVLDPLFIFGLKLEVKGAALATVISQAVAGIYIIRVFLMKKSLVPVSWSLKNVDLSIIKEIVAVGFPQTAGQIMMAVSFLLFNRLVVAIDSLALSAFSICGRFDQIIILPTLAIASAVVTMTGQNYGRRNFERVKHIWRAGVLLTGGVVLFIASFIVLFAPTIYPFFSNVDRVVDYAVRQTRTIEFAYIFAAIAILSRSTFQAIGTPFPALVITVLRLAVIAVPTAYLLVYVFDLGMYGVWFGIITGNGIGAFVSLLWMTTKLRNLDTRSDGERD